MIIEQILVTPLVVFCYLIVDETTREAALIDPAGDFSKIDKIIRKHNAKIKYIINTHGHYDHISGNEYYLKNQDAILLIHARDVSKLGDLARSVTKDFRGNKNSKETGLKLKDGDNIKIGSSAVSVIETPGHSEGSICLYSKGHVFTGDTLFTAGMGRTDLPDGSMQKIQHSIKKKILALPNNTKIWPGHHYGRNPFSTVKDQKELYMR